MAKFLVTIEQTVYETYEILIEDAKDEDDARAQAEVHIEHGLDAFDQMCSDVTSEITFVDPQSDED